MKSIVHESAPKKRVERLAFWGISFFGEAVLFQPFDGRNFDFAS